MKWSAGMPLKTLEKPAFTREQLRDYAAAALDHNPIHLDDAFAKESGFPSVIVHGMLSMAFMGDHLARNFPPTRFVIARFRARFRKVTFPGDVLTCTGEVKKELPDGKLLIGLKTQNQTGEVTTEGEAEVLPL